MNRSPHTRLTKGKKQKAKFKKYLPFESVTSLADAKYLAVDRAETYRYTYRATAVTSGNAAVKVGEQIYLADLAQGMSGYWTVLSVNHVFGSGNAKYQLELELGADVLGQENPVAKASERNLEAELANQSLTPAPSALTSYSAFPTEGTVEEYSDQSLGIKNIKPDYATTPTSNLYDYDTPDFSTLRKTTEWRAI
jgi:hypothetical protein